MARGVASILIAAAVALVAPAFAQTPQPTPLVPEAPATDSPGMYLLFGMGPVPDGTDRLLGDLPTLAFTVGGSIPIKGRAYVDLGLYTSVASYTAVPAYSWFGSGATVSTVAFTASGRFGHTGHKVAVFGSAGVGFGYVMLDTQIFGIIPAEVDSVWAPVFTIAGSLETPVRKKNRFLAELRYSWIDVDFGSDAGGSLNAGGAALLLGWRHVF